MSPELLERICALRNRSDMLYEKSLSLRAESLNLRQEMARLLAGFRILRERKRSFFAETQPSEWF